MKTPHSAHGEGGQTSLQRVVRLTLVEVSFICRGPTAVCKFQHVRGLFIKTSNFPKHGFRTLGRTGGHDPYGVLSNQPLTLWRLARSSVSCSMPLLFSHRSSVGQGAGKDLVGKRCGHVEMQASIGSTFLAWSLGAYACDPSPCGQSLVQGCVCGHLDGVHDRLFTCQ